MPGIFKMVPGAGIESARLAAGDFEFAVQATSPGKWGNAECILKYTIVLINQVVMLF